MTKSHSHSSSRGKGPVFSRISSTIGGFLLLVLGLFFFSLTLGQVREDLQHRRWLETPCVVTSVKSSNDGESYHLTITYTYSVAGREFTSSQYSASKKTLVCSKLSQRNKAEEKFKKGATAVCYVNPHDSSDAILDRSSTSLFPLIFSLVYSGLALSVLLRTWRKGSSCRSGSPEDSSRPPAPGTDPSPQRDFTIPQDTPRGRRKTGDILPVLIGALFTAIGLFIFSIFFRKTFNSCGQWETTEGTVIISKIATYRTKNGTRSKPYISYAYEVDGKKYENDTFAVGAMIRPRENTAAIVASHRPGTTTTVYYDVKEPQRSALEIKSKKSFTDFVVFVFPAIFIALGGTVLVAGLKQLLGDKPMPWQNAPIAGLKLKRVRELQGKVFFTVIWCAFCTMFTTIWFTQTSEPFSWTWSFWSFDKFFVLTFPLVGVGLIVSCIKSAIRGASSGHYSVEVSAIALTPGARMQVNYILSAPAPKHKKITFFIGQTSSDPSSLHTHNGEGPLRTMETEVYATMEPASLRQGTFSCTIPSLPTDDEECFNTWTLFVRYGKSTDRFTLPVKKAARP